MRAMASLITGVSIVYSAIYSGRSKKTSKLHATDLCEGNSSVTGEFPAQRASNMENVSICWRRHVKYGPFYGIKLANQGISFTSILTFISYIL